MTDIPKELGTLRSAVTVLASDVDRQAAETQKAAAAASEARDVAEAASQAARQLSGGVRQLTEQVRTIANRPAPAGGSGQPTEMEPPWMHVHDEPTAQVLMTSLVEWLADVFMRYHGGNSLGECWAWHPGIVAELLALRAAWFDAYQGEGATPGKVMDWHDRWRPGVVKRISAELQKCTLDMHGVDGARQYQPVHVAGAEQVAELATWWATTHGQSAAPPPSPNVRAAVQGRRRSTASY